MYMYIYDREGKKEKHNASSLNTFADTFGFRMFGLWIIIYIFIICIKRVIVFWPITTKLFICSWSDKCCDFKCETWRTLVEIIKNAV